MSIAKKPLAFIGPMGSGKTSLAKRAAAKYGGEIFDTDREFTSRYGEISAFFACRGEAEFRKVEQQLLKEAAISGAEYISTGGGAVLGKEGMSALRAACDIVYLSAPTDILKARIMRSDRPLKNDLDRVLSERAPLYERYADYKIDTGVDSLSELEKALAVPRKNRYDIALVDSDDTVLDFNAACAQAVEGALKSLGVQTDYAAAARLFRPLTQSYWQRLEKDEITREQLFIERERAFGEAIGHTFKECEFNEAYRSHLRETKCVLPGAKEFFISLRERGIKVYVITNADVYCATERLKPLSPYADGLFISEAMGCNKPDSAYFDKVFEALGHPDKSRVIVFGDSETSDIAGGMRYGLDTCRFDRTGKAQTAADYRVTNYAAFLDIV